MILIEVFIKYQFKFELNNYGIYNFENETLKLIKSNFEIIPEKFKKLSLENLYCLNNGINLKCVYIKEYWNYIKINF